MSIRKALKIRKSFTVEQQLFAKEQKLDGEHTAAEWIDFLEEIAEFDSYVDAARKKTTTIMTVLIVLTILSFIGTLASNGLALPVFLLLFLAMIVYIAIYAGLKKVDIPNRFRLFVFPLVRMLQDEMKEDSKIYIKADFKVGMKKEYLVRKTDGTYDKNLRKKVDSEFFSYPVLELKTRFADGNVLSLYINDSSRKNSIRKTNYRGKTKWKTKYKIKTKIEVSLAAKETAYSLLRTNNPQPNTKTSTAITQTKKEDKNIITYRHLKVSTTDEYIPEIDIVLSAIATTYQQLKPVAA